MVHSHNANTPNSNVYHNQEEESDDDPFDQDNQRIRNPMIFKGEAIPLNNFTINNEAGGDFAIENNLQVAGVGQGGAHTHHLLSAGVVQGLRNEDSWSGQPTGSDE